uniref:Uncharacterized protein n=1 Tax=viral metagenome TaxID=1070528 RepID=A0A6C0KGN8_9ZZZZ
MDPEKINKEAQNMTNDELKQKVCDIRNNQIIELIIRQTDYTKEEVIERLKKNNNNYLLVIKEYMTDDKVIEHHEEKKSVNQNIYSNIRNFLDDNIKEKAHQAQLQNKMKQQKEAYEQAKQNKKIKEDENKSDTEEIITEDPPKTTTVIDL